MTPSLTWKSGSNVESQSLLGELKLWKQLKIICYCRSSSHRPQQPSFQLPRLPCLADGHSPFSTKKDNNDFLGRLVVRAGLEIRATKMKVNMVETAVTVFTTHTNSVQFNSLTQTFVLREKLVLTLRLERRGRWTVDSPQNLKLQQFYQFET